MILKDTNTGALLNIDNFEAIYPLEELEEFKTKIIMVSPSLNAGWYETEATVEELLEYIKTKRLFIVKSWRQKWN